MVDFQILVSIIGTNDSAVISKLDYVIEAATSAQIEKANGFLRVKDKDTNEAKFISQQTVGDYGTFTLTADGAWNYASTQSNHHLMSLGSSVKDNFTVSALDGTTRDISISITGSKNPSPTTTDDGYGNNISYELKDNKEKVLNNKNIDKNNIKGIAVGGCLGPINDTLLKRGTSGFNHIPNMIEWFDMDTLIALISPRPCLIIAGRKDHIYPYHLSKKIVDKVLSQIKNLLNEGLDQKLLFKFENKKDKRIKNYFLSDEFYHMILDWIWIQKKIYNS